MKRRLYPADPWFYSTFDMAEEIVEVRERRLAKEATLEVAEQSE